MGEARALGMKISEAVKQERMQAGQG